MDAQNKGISTVYQEVNLCPNLSVAENLFIGREPVTKLGTVNRKKMNAMAEKLMKHCPYVATSYAEGLKYGHDFHLTLKSEKSMQCVESGIKFMDKVCEEIDKKKATV